MTCLGEFALMETCLAPLVFFWIHANKRWNPVVTSVMPHSCWHCDVLHQAPCVSMKLNLWTCLCFFLLDQTAGCHPGGAAALCTGCSVIFGSAYVTILLKLKMCFEVLVTAQQTQVLFMCSCCLWLCSHSCCFVIELVLAQCSSGVLGIPKERCAQNWWWSVVINLCCVSSIYIL